MSVTARFFVGGLPVDCTPAEIKSQFDSFGSVSGVNVRKKGGVAFGFVNVDLNSEAAAAKVVNGLNNSLWRGQRVKVERAKDDPSERKRPASSEAPPAAASWPAVSAAVPDVKAKRQRTDETPPFVAPAVAPVATVPAEPRKSSLRNPARSQDKKEKRKSGKDDNRAAEPTTAAPPTDNGKRVAFAEPSDGKKDTKAERRKKNKSSKAAAAAALAGERERKVRETPVAAVAKATAWDTVLGHAWEDTGEREQFSLLESLGVVDAPPDETPFVEYQPVATRYARSKMERATGAEAIKSLQHKMQQRRTAEAADATAAGAADMAADYGLLFVSQKDSLQEQAKQWIQGMAVMRNDFKKKRKRALKRSKGRGK